MPARYSNLDPTHRPHRLGAVLRWAVWDRLTGRRRIAPAGLPAPAVAADLERLRGSDPSPRLTWIGHSSFLLSLAGAHVLIDPVFSPRIGRVYERHGRAGLQPPQLPPVTAVLLSHNHYDHLDLPSLRALAPGAPIVAPLGLGSWLRRRGFAASERGWWETVELGPLRVTLVPARHWSRRTPFDTNRTWWCGFVVEGGGRAVYHSGDTADFAGFALIAHRFPALDAALLPIGAYAPAWFMASNHLNPEEAGRAFLTLGATSLVPMHWGAFQLTDEPLSEPIERLRAWWQREGSASGRTLREMAVGETVGV